jgi:hypothetical protein
MKRKRIKIKMTGTRVSPESVPVHELGDLLTQLQRAIIEILKAQGVDATEDYISLVGIKKGSNLLTVSVPDRASPALRVIAKAAKTQDYTPIPLEAHRSLFNIYKKAAEKEWKLELLGSPALKIPKAVISINHPVPEIEVERVVSGSTTLYGRIIGVGGERKSKVRLRLVDGSALDIDADEDFARTCGRLIYEDVALDGEVAWNANWELMSFRATGARQVFLPNVADAVDELANLCGSNWKDVDAATYVSGLRQRTNE